MAGQPSVAAGAAHLSLHSLTASARANALPYALALLNAVAWAFYSNLARRWGPASGGGGVPLFVLATGAIMAAGALATGAALPAVSGKTIGIIFYVALVVNLLGYVLWERAMRRGNLPLVSSVANFIPLIAVFIACVVMGTWPGAMIWLACGLIIAGAAVCKLSLAQR
jgi:drug/metabolite transporter (DMT)-like permease